MLCNALLLAAEMLQSNFLIFFLRMNLYEVKILFVKRFTTSNEFDYILLLILDTDMLGILFYSP